MKLKPIGIIHTPYTESSGTPIQPKYAGDARGGVEVFDEYADGLKDIEGFERIWLIYGADRARKVPLLQVPYRDTVERGVFAIRSPSRPNPILISPVRLLGRNGNTLEIAELDMLNGTPLFDIKPYIARVDCFPDAKGGWFDEARGSESGNVKADDRFSE